MVGVLVLMAVVPNALVVAVRVVELVALIDVPVLVVVVLSGHSATVHIVEQVRLVDVPRSWPRC